MQKALDSRIDQIVAGDSNHDLVGCEWRRGGGGGKCGEQMVHAGVSVYMWGRVRVRMATEIMNENASTPDMIRT